MHLSRRTLASVSCGLVLRLGGDAAAAPRKPAPPPGRDPGGIAVALVGDGLDYMAPDIARRLARDGEGELIGWDLVDSDRQPYAPPGGSATALARIVLAEGQATRLIPVRIQPGPPTGLVPALQFVAPTPARIAGLLPSTWSGLVPQDRLADVAAHLPRCLIVVGARHLMETAAQRPNVLAVTVLPDSGQPPRLGARADVAIPLAAGDSALIDAAGRSGAPPEDIAVARVLALAARLIGVKPALDGAGLKTELIGHARPMSEPSAHSPTHGWITDVGRIHWPK